MIKFSLRKKLLFYSVILAIIPLGIASYYMIQITQDELKSVANDELSITAADLANEIDDLYRDTWLAPLLLIKGGLENDDLGINEKVSLLKSALNVSDIISVQLNLDVPNMPPSVIAKEDIVKKITPSDAEGKELMKIPLAEIEPAFGRDNITSSNIKLLPGSDLWILDIIIPLSKQIRGIDAVLSSRINLERLKTRIATHPFNNSGEVNLLYSTGVKVFDTDSTSLMSRELVSNAVALLNQGNRTIGVKPYVRDDGTEMLGAFAFPQNFPLAIVTERTAEDAYLAVSKMRNTLSIWIILGIVIAALGGFIFSGGISKPILEVGRVAQIVGKGNFSTMVPKLKSGDEIAELGNRMNEMIIGLRERFELQKFVSGNTIDAIKRADVDGIKLGGTREVATVFFSDIRGFTAFSEKVEPEIVIEMLNKYLREQARLVKKYGGDIDKYVGDELVAVFKGNDMVDNAMKCAVEIHQKITELNSGATNWDIAVGIGINSGDMIMGAMGSEERMDYTVLGDNVNLGARLCSAATKNQTIISSSSYNMIQNKEIFSISPLEPIKVKGKDKPLTIYEVVSFKS